MSMQDDLTGQWEMTFTGLGNDPEKIGTGDLQLTQYVSSVSGTMIGPFKKYQIFGGREGLRGEDGATLHHFEIKGVMLPEGQWQLTYRSSDKSVHESGIIIIHNVGEDKWVGNFSGVDSITKKTLGGHVEMIPG